MPPLGNIYTNVGYIYFSFSKNCYKCPISENKDKNTTNCQELQKYKEYLKKEYSKPILTWNNGEIIHHAKISLLLSCFERDDTTRDARILDTFELLNKAGYPTPHKMKDFTRLSTKEKQKIAVETLIKALKDLPNGGWSKW